MAETLRLELAPFGVKVLSVVSGALRTMGQTHFDDWKLPADSLYAPLEETIRNRARGQEGAPRMEPEVYAKRVVSEITAGRAGRFWYGASAGIVKFAVSYLPTWLMVNRFRFSLACLDSFWRDSCSTNTYADTVAGQGRTSANRSRLAHKSAL